MTSQERVLYQQIHPVKLLADFGTSFASTWLVWQGQYVQALIVGFVPSVIVTLWLVRFADLEYYRRTFLGQYVELHMPRKIVAARIAGQLMVWIGAAVHAPWIIPFGYWIILLAWLNGLWTAKH